MATKLIVYFRHMTNSSVLNATIKSTKQTYIQPTKMIHLKTRKLLHLTKSKLLPIPTKRPIIQYNPKTTLCLQQKRQNHVLIQRPWTSSYFLNEEVLQIQTPYTDTTKTIYSDASSSSQPSIIVHPRKTRIKKSSSLKSLPNMNIKNQAT